MSESDASSAIHDSLSNEATRPQTVLLTKLRPENSCSEEDTSIGSAFFSKHNDAIDINKKNEENPATNFLEINSHDTDGETNDYNVENGTNSPKLRPKTVTKQRTGGYQQKLVNIGAVESNKPKLTQDQTSLSPKPKSEKCYICGKEFLLSSLKIHEKQCAKKHEKASKINNKTSPTTGFKVSRKLQLEACYLCGKEFFIHSLGIHETQCIKHWKADKAPDAKDQTVSERTLKETHCNNFEQELNKANVPKEQMSAKEEASKAQNSSPKLEKNSSGSKKKGLKTIPCYLCGVAFLQHSLKIHEKKCRGQSHDLNQDNGSKRVEKDEHTPLNPSTSEESYTLEEDEGLQSNSDPLNTDADNSSNTCVSKKPKTIICYICGQEFLKSSYAFHEKKCTRMNESVVAEETPTENRKGQSNTRSSGKPKTVICYICGEEFLKSSYAFHEKKCANVVENTREKEKTPERSKEKTKTESSSKPAEAAKDNQNSSKNSPKPRTIVCYICGQEFLKSSYTIHEKQCASKNRNVEEESKNEKGTSSDLERPETPRRKPKTQPCYVCGKEMLSSSLKIHEQQCQKKTEILKNINQQKSPAQKRAGRQAVTTKDKAEAKPKTQVCYICGETFLVSSIKVHETQCEKRWNGKT